MTDTETTRLTPVEDEIRAVLNRYSAEAPSGTPDHILAAYLIDCLKAFNEAVTLRAEWRGEPVDFTIEAASPTDPDAELVEKMARAAHGTTLTLDSGKTWEGIGKIARDAYLAQARASLAAQREHEATR